MKLTEANYYSQKANQAFFSVSQFKSFQRCPAAAMAELRGEFTAPRGRALILGSYFDEMLTGTPNSQAKFIAENYTELFQKSSKMVSMLGKLKNDKERKDFLSGLTNIFSADNKPFADVVQANETLERVKAQPLMMKYLNGGHQKIMIGEIEGCPVKGKFDSYKQGEFIADLKYLKDFRSPNMFENAISFYSYDMQLAVYRELVRQNTGEILPCYLVIATKQDPADLAVVEINGFDLDNALEKFKKQIRHFQDIKNGTIPAVRCEDHDCPYCRGSKILTEVIDSSILGMSRKQLEAMGGVM